MTLNDKYQKLGTDFVASTRELRPQQSYAIKNGNWSENNIYVGYAVGNHIFINEVTEVVEKIGDRKILDMIDFETIAFQAPD